MSAVLLLAGVALVAGSVVQGGARVAVFVVFPVISGGSAEFLAGVLLLIVGAFSLPFSLTAGSAWEESPVPPDPSSPVSRDSGGGVGGFVLVGPVPIVFGSWKGMSRRMRWTLALFGALALTVAIVVLVVLAL